MVIVLLIKKIPKYICNLARFYPQGNFLAASVVAGVLPILVSSKLKHLTEPCSSPGR